MPLGVKLIAAWYIFQTVLGALLFALILGIVTIGFSLDQLGTPKTSKLVAAVHTFISSGSWTGPYALVGYGIIAASLFLLWFHAYIGFGLLGGKKRAHFWCLALVFLAMAGCISDIALYQSGMYASWMTKLSPSFSEEMTPMDQAQIGFSLIRLVPLALVAGYLLLPGVKRQFR